MHGPFCDSSKDILINEDSEQNEWYYKEILAWNNDRETKIRQFKLLI